MSVKRYPDRCPIYPDEIHDMLPQGPFPTNPPFPALPLGRKVGIRVRSAKYEIWTVAIGKSWKVDDNIVTATDSFIDQGGLIMKQSQGRPIDGSIGGKLFLRRSGHAFCPVCSKQVELISFADAAELFHTDIQDIEFLTKQGDVHQIHNRKGKIMACTVSLFECFDNRRTRLLDSGIIKEMAAEKSA